MINVIATITVKAGRRFEFIELFKNNVPAVLAEEGCIEYFPAVDTPTDIDAQATSASTVTVIEKWQDIDCLKAHLEAPHMVTFRERVANLVDDVSLRILEQC
jgi:quinol monooxygenase YgiN